MTDTDVKRLEEMKHQLNTVDNDGVTWLITKLEAANEEIERLTDRAITASNCDAVVLAAEREKVEKLRDAIIEALRHHLSPSHIWEATKVLEQALTDTEDK